MHYFHNQVREESSVPAPKTDGKTASMSMSGNRLSSDCNDEMVDTSSSPSMKASAALEIPPSPLRRAPSVEEGDNIAIGTIDSDVSISSTLLRNWSGVLAEAMEEDEKEEFIPPSPLSLLFCRGWGNAAAAATAAAAVLSAPGFEATPRNGSTPGVVIAD